jgi:hypothetical protein
MKNAKIEQGKVVKAAKGVSLAALVAGLAACGTHGAMAPKTHHHVGRGGEHAGTGNDTNTGPSHRGGADKGSATGAGAGTNPSTGGTSGGTITPTTIPPATLTSTAVIFHGTANAGKTIPWSQIGPGWNVALWNQSPAHETAYPTTLYVVSPTGARYSAGTFAAGEQVFVESWSGDKQRIIVDSWLPNVTGQIITEIDMASGATLHEFVVKNFSNIAYTSPEGYGYLVNTTLPSSGAPVYALSRDLEDGTTTMTYPEHFSEVGHYSGSALETPDGTEIVMAAQSGVAVIGNNGNLVRQIPIAGANGCTVHSWWAAADALVDCYLKATGDTYFSVAVSGAVPTLLAKNAPLGGNLFQMPTGIYGMDGACSAIWIVHYENGKWVNISIPGTLASGSTWVVGATSDTLQVMATPSCGSGKNPPAPALLTYDPVANTSRVILGGKANGGIVEMAIGYGYRMDI